jgi:hypothetical protein
MQENGVEVLYSESDNAYYIPTAQQYGRFAKEMLGVQRYPKVKLGAGPNIVPPYDMTAWSLPLIMGVSVEKVKISADKQSSLSLGRQCPSEGQKRRIQLPPLVAMDQFRIPCAAQSADRRDVHVAPQCDPLGSHEKELKDRVIKSTHQKPIQPLKGHIQMKTENSNLLTAGAIAKELAMPDAKVKKAIADLKIKPAAKKGVCNLYGKEVIPKIKSVLK